MTTDEPAKARNHPDWERIALDYRAGVKSLRQIADEHGITHTAINKRARRDGWERDLSARIASKADALVSKAAVSTPVSTVSTATEQMVVDANARALADARLAHRRDIGRARSIVNDLMAEMAAQAGPENVALLSRLSELAAQQDASPDRLREALGRVLSLPGRAKTLKDLSESMRVLVGLERQAFGMDAKDAAADDAPLKVHTTVTFVRPPPREDDAQEVAA